MAKTTYKRKRLIGSLLMVSEGEYMTIMTGSMAAGSAGGVAESPHLMEGQSKAEKGRY